jgi:N-acetylglucosamine-6-phosphate deacetylase
MRLGVEAALVDGQRIPGDVEVRDGLVVAVGLQGQTGVGLAAPGLVDLQVNGFAGVDLLDADSDGYAHVGAALLETGVTAYLPTFITSPEERVVAALERVSTLDVSGPRILGVHLEGPFLSTRRLGVHQAEWRRDPDPALLNRLLAAGPVRLMTLAPELPGADDLIDRLVAAGVVVSIGHTDATAEVAQAAFRRGVRTVTHLFNAMPPLGHREPGVAGAALASPDVVVQVIADRIHVAEDILRIVLAAAPDRLALVTDAMAGAGEGDGTYLLGEVPVIVSDGVARRKDGALAGSVLTLIEAVRNLHELGAPLERAIAAASSVPASVIGQSDVGRLTVGGPADIIVLDDNLELIRVLVRGEECVTR